MKEIIINNNFHALKSLVRDYAPHSLVYKVPKEEINYLSEREIELQEELIKKKKMLTETLLLKTLELQLGDKYGKRNSEN